MMTRALREQALNGGPAPFHLAVVPPATATEWSRRGFLKVTGSAVGLLLAFQLTARTARAAELAAPVPTGGFSPNAFLRIAPSGEVTVILNHAEMGQGIGTALPMLVAEELDADWSKIRTEFSPVDPVYNHSVFGIQITGGSTSTWTEYDRLRQAGATARALLVTAAAAEWNVPESECRTEAGFVIHSGGRRLDYGVLASRAALLPAPGKAPLKDPSNFKLIGRPTARLDSHAKVTGEAEFGLDVDMPGRLVAMVARAPVFGGKVEKFDSASALAIPGVKAVLPVPSGIVVIATDTWIAKLGRDAVAAVIQWQLPTASLIDSKAQAQQFKELARQPGAVAAQSGDVAAALKGAAKVVEADYSFPYLAHAPMEPLNATVSFTGNAAEVWSGTQFPTVDRAQMAEVFGIKPEQIALHTTFLGGGFGRRAVPSSDWMVEAAHVAKVARAAGILVPIQTVWTREDDLMGGYYRPMFHHHLVGGVDGGGKIVAWKQTLVGQSFMAGTPFESAMVKNGVDETSVEGASDAPYQIVNRRVELHSPSLPVPTLWWRSVGHTHTALAVECFLDELAQAAGRDPLEVRRELLPPDSRERRVLDLVIEKSGYGKTKLPVGHAQGIAVHESFGSFVGAVAEISLLDGWPRVHRMTVAVDCGTVVNPLTVEAQIQGSVNYALSALLYGEITLEKGRVQQKNFHQYRVLRMNEAPVVDVHVIAKGDKMGGIGETGVPPVFASVVNALSTLTGKRVRSLPFTQAGPFTVAMT